MAASSGMSQSKLWPNFSDEDVFGIIFRASDGKLILLKNIKNRKTARLIWEDGGSDRNY